MAKAKAAPAAGKPAKKSGGGGSKFDYKGFLLQHGDRVGVATAGVLALLLFGLILVPSLFGESATDMASNLEKPSEAIQKQLDDPGNVPGDNDKPPKDSDEKLRVTLDTTSVDGGKFRIAGLLPPGSQDDRLRRQPKVLPLDEAAVALARVQVRTYMFATNAKEPMVFVLKGEGNAADGDKNKAGMFPPPAGGGDFGNKFGKGGGAPPMPGGGVGGAGGAGGLLDFLKNRRKGKVKFTPPSDITSKDSKVAGKKLEAVPIKSLDKSATLATQVQPVRMAIIAGAFPYAAQVEEFRSRIGARSHEDVLSEASAVLDAKGNPQYAFRFLGVDVERRELESDGITPLATPEGQWKAPPGLANEYRDLVFATGREFEPEDKELGGLFFQGLYMKRPPQFRSLAEAEADKTGNPMVPPMPGGPMPPPVGNAPGKNDKEEKTPPAPPEDQYPALEKSLPKIQKTLDDLKDKVDDVAPPPSSKFSKSNDYELFGSEEGSLSKDEFKQKGATGPVSTLPGSKGPAMPQEPDKEAAQKPLPGHCLVRVLDVTVQPGRTYEYRLKVRMANPNQGRNDTASSKYAEGKELPSSAWSSSKLVLRVPSELHYYAVNQADLEPLVKKDGKMVGFKDNLKSNPNATFFQVHRWVESVTRGKDSEVTPVGEWVVAQRFQVFRGEFIGRSERVEIPHWQPTLEDFVILTDSTTDKTKAGIAVNMGHDRPDGKEALLVDFEQGRTGFTKVVGKTKEGRPDTKTISDTSAGETVLMTPEGRLAVRETAIDVADAVRAERAKKVRERVEDVKKRNKLDDKGTTPGKVFGN